MRFAALTVGVLLVIQALVGLGVPEAFLGLIARIQQPPALYVAAALRVLIGVTLLLAAPASRLPRVLGTLGVVIAIGGLLTPFLGARLAGIILGEWSRGGPGVIRAWAALSLALGALVLYCLWPRQNRPVR